MRPILPLLLILLCLGTAPARAQSGSREWDALRALVGEWAGEGSGAPGQGTGGFSFTEDLAGKVLVRRNRAEYPATKDRPAFVHEDLMVVYRAPGSAQPRADYYDNEGHVIHYGVEVSGDGTAITFLSDAQPSGFAHLNWPTSRI